MEILSNGLEGQEIILELLPNTRSFQILSLLLLYNITCLIYHRICSKWLLTRYVRDILVYALISAGTFLFIYKQEL